MEQVSEWRTQEDKKRVQNQFRVQKTKNGTRTIYLLLQEHSKTCQEHEHKTRARSKATKLTFEMHLFIKHIRKGSNRERKETLSVSISGRRFKASPSRSCGGGCGARHGGWWPNGMEDVMCSLSLSLSLVAPLKSEDSFFFLCPSKHFSYRSKIKGWPTR